MLLRKLSRITMKMKNSIQILFVLFALLSCTDSTEMDPIYLSDLIDLNGIDSIRVNNNSGKHILNADQFIQFKKELGAMQLDKGSYKMGSIGFSLYINGQELFFTGSTHGDYFEAHADYVTKNKDRIETDWIYFKTNGMNLDNY